MPLAWFACPCRKPRLRRVPRAWWMRLLPGLRLYRCQRCGCNLLRTRVGLRDVYPLY